MTIGHSLTHRNAQQRSPATISRDSMVTSRARPRLSPSARSSTRELLLLAALYIGYTASRLLASDRLSDAAGRARGLLHVETLVDLDWEARLNSLFTEHDWLGIVGSYWYASGHYVVTLVTLVWLYTRHRDVYHRARTALVGATLTALVFYLVMPTAPPRLLSGFTDVLDLHADVGWWGAEASAPKGLGGTTNQLAAFPSMHAGWALWVALAVAAATRSWLVRAVGFLYAATTALVVIGTANHWVLDVLSGTVVVVLAWAASAALPTVLHRCRRLRLEVTVPSAVPVPGFRLTTYGK